VQSVFGSGWDCCMEVLDYLRRQFAYNEWANREVLQQMRQTGKPSKRSLQLMAHVLSAERLWMERLQQQPQSLQVWPEFDLEKCETQAKELARLWSEYLATLRPPDLSHEISYKNTKGEPWTNTVLDVLTHVVMHSAYHRGQIATDMRAGAQTPPYTDFIHAVRRRLIK
jgi:uncharacterized damage-inducible protein DinB